MLTDSSSNLHYQKYALAVEWHNFFPNLNFIIIKNILLSGFITPEGLNHMLHITHSPLLLVRTMSRLFPYVNMSVGLVVI